MQTTNDQQTLSFGKRIGGLLRGAEILELVSDVGGGKTTLTKGIVAGAGVQEIVSSPTFTVSKVYQADRFEIHHYDFYRLGEIGLMSEELQEVIDSKSDVAIIEWAGSTHHQLPAGRTVQIAIERVAEAEDDRKLIFDLPESLTEWVEKLGLQKC